MKRLIFVLALLLTCAQAGHVQAQSGQDEQHKRLTHFLIGSYIAASGADLSSTQFCLGAKTCHEANPILKPLEDRPIAFGVVKMATSAAIATILVKQHHKHPKAVRWIAAGLAVGSAYVAIRNTRTAAKR